MGKHLLLDRGTERVDGRPQVVRSVRNGLSPIRTASGFTLVEVFVLVGLLGIVAALMLQNATGYRQRAQDALAAHDVGNAIAAEEAYFAAEQRYVSVPRVVGPRQIEVPGFAVSDHVELAIEADADGFRVTATSLRGAGVVYEYESDTGVIAQR